MPLVPAICPQCGGQLQVDPTHKGWVCDFCGTPFVTEQAINKYNITNNNFIQNATFVNGDTEQRLLERGIKQLELQEYSSAQETFTEMSKKYPENYKGWLGCYICYSQLPLSNTDYSAQSDKLRNHAISNCPSDKKEILQQNRVRSSHYIQRLNTEIAHLEAMKNHANENIQSSRTQKASGDKDTQMHKVAIFLGAAFMIGGAGLFLDVINGTNPQPTLSFLISVILAVVGFNILRSSIKEYQRLSKYYGQNYDYSLNKLTNEVEQLNQNLTRTKKSLEQEQKNRDVNFFVKLLKE